MELLVQSFSKSYGTGSRSVTACKDIDFRAEKGKITTLLGPNGAGKSTLLKTISGLILASSGDIVVAGERSLDRIRAVTGYVGENPFLDQDLTVAECLAFEAELHGVKAENRKELIKKAVDTTGLYDVLTKKCRSLSKGYAQRVNLAKALSFDPPVLILDEFSAGLDPAQIVSIRSSLKRLAKEKIVVVSTHNINEALEISGIIYIMFKGKFVSSGSPEEILAMTNKKTLEEAFLALTSKEI